TLFFEYYYELCSVALKVTKSPEGARDVVQDVFLRLWKNRSRWQIQISLKAYLYQAVWNQALNHREKKARLQKTREQFVKEHVPSSPQIDDIKGTNRQLIAQIWAVVKNMPERRQFVFTLHRKHGLRYKEIAHVLGLSRKTVENHMGLALKEIREKIDYERMG